MNQPPGGVSCGSWPPNVGDVIATVDSNGVMRQSIVMWIEPTEHGATLDLLPDPEGEDV